MNQEEVWEQLSCQDWKCLARARAKARAMCAQGPTRAQGEPIVIIDQVERVKNGQQGGENLNDDGELNRPVAVNRDGSHSWSVQLWGSRKRC